MKLTGRVPVESLSDDRWTRIERTIVSGASDAAARPVHRPRFVQMLAVAAALLLVLGAGAVGWKLHGGLSARDAVAMEPPIHVQTQARGSVLDIGDATIQSDPPTTFTVTRPDGGVLVALARGRVELAVLPRGPQRAPLVVHAGDTEVIVVGTRFSVDYGGGTGDVDVRVTEGVVRVVRHRRETRVAAGQAWSSQRAAVLPLAEHDAAVAAAKAGATIDDGAPRGSDDLAIDMGDAPNVLRDRVAAVPDANPSAPPRAGTPRGGTASTGSVRGAAPRGKPALDNPRDPQFDLKSLIRSQPVLPALDIGEPDALKAMSEYRQIMTRDNGPREAHALYSMAVIQALKLGRTGDALGTLGALKRLAPASEYYVPALWLEVRIRCLRQIDEACRQAAYIYVRRAPEGPTFRVAEKITLSK